MRIGIDLGGTKIEGILLDAQGQEVSRKRIATPQGDYDATIGAIVELVRDIAVGTKKGTSPLLDPGAGVGIGIPGTLSSSSGRVKNANSTCLIGRSFDQDLQKALGRPVRLANDANCFTLSEATDGAAAGVESVFGVILGTGVGGGIVVGGHLLHGPNAIAGEWGHNPLPWPQDHERPGPSCYCGKTGCLETFLSGPALSRDHADNSRQTLSAEAIVESAQQGDKDAIAALARYEDRLARGLSHVINILDPGCIVMGGGLSAIGRLYENVPEIWGKYVFSDRVTTSLVPPRHGDSSGVRGAAWLWPDQG